MKSIVVGVIEQSGGAALPCPGRWQGAHGLEHLNQVAALTTRISYHKEPEYLLLQGLAHHLAALLQRFNLLGKTVNFIANFLHLGFMTLTDAPQLGFFITALVQERFLLLVVQAAGPATGIPFLLVARHHCLKAGDFIGHYLSLIGMVTLHCQQLGRMLQAFHLMVDRRNLRLASLELTLRVEQVINRRHKEIVMYATCQIARERS